MARRPPGQDALLYLIALLLVRKRLCRLVDLVTEGDEEFLRLRRPGSDATFLVPAPLLSPADLPRLRSRLEALIDGAIEDEDLEVTAPGAAQESTDLDAYGEDG